MIEKDGGSITIIMPVYNGETTLKQVFAGLEKQHDKTTIDQIIIINDHSSDQSGQVITAYIKDSSYTVQVIHHTSSHGLAAGYNEGIKLAKTPYVLLMHQDIVLTSNRSFANVLNPFKNTNVVATYPVLLHPYEVWKGYSFWQKCLFSRYVNKKLPILTGKFDCFSRQFLEEVGYFDNKTYRTAGEDSDLKIKIRHLGREIANSGVEVIHLQYAEKDFSLGKWVKKEAQLAEAQGVILRKYGIYDIKGVVLSFFRQILLIGLFIPYIFWLFASLIVVYAITYTKLVYIKEYKNPRVVLVPFINVFLLCVALVASARGFVRERQVI
jgi:glycosyltransferase involved in cell wall biosynthesis